MVAGFAGFGFPKAHSVAFGLLAYESTWLRVHYGPEFLCALLNEQPMGFYHPTASPTRPSGAASCWPGRHQRLSGVECSALPRARCGSAWVSARRTARGGRGARGCPRGRRAVSDGDRARRTRPASTLLTRAARVVGGMRRARRNAPGRVVGARCREPLSACEGRRPVRAPARWRQDRRRCPRSVAGSCCSPTMRRAVSR